MLHDANGIQRNGGTSIELLCVIKHYPKRSLLVMDSLLESDVREHVKKAGGIHLDLVDYPHHTVTLLKWEDINSVQFFVPHRRGDRRPVVELSLFDQEYQYYQEMVNKIKEAKDQT